MTSKTTTGAWHVRVRPTGVVGRILPVRGATALLPLACVPLVATVNRALG